MYSYSGAALFEVAVHMGMELYSGDAVKREEFVKWYIETEGGTVFPLSPIVVTTENDSYNYGFG